MFLSACGAKGNLYPAVEPEKVPETVINKPQPNSENSQKKQP